MQDCINVDCCIAYYNTPRSSLEQPKLTYAFLAFHLPPLQCGLSLQANFAALMSKAKANTQQVSGAALARQAELEAQRKREVELEKQNAAREKERRLKELEARQRREQERLELEERLRLERERKRAQKVHDSTTVYLSSSTTKLNSCLIGFIGLAG